MNAKIKKLKNNIDKIDELILEVFQQPLHDNQKALLMKINKHLNDIEKTFGLYEESPNKEAWEDLTKTLVTMANK